MLVPGTSLGWLSVLTMLRSYCTSRSVVSVLLLLALVVSSAPLTVAVLDSVPVAAGAMVALTV